MFPSSQSHRPHLSVLVASFTFPIPDMKPSKRNIFFLSKPVGENMVGINAQGSSANGEELELELRADLISSVERLKG